MKRKEEPCPQMAVKMSMSIYTREHEKVIYLYIQKESNNMIYELLRNT